MTPILLSNGIKNILVEKPGALTRQEMEAIRDMTTDQSANVYIAYNRRYYASTQKALEIIEEDGGVSSFHYDVKEKTFFIIPHMLWIWHFFRRISCKNFSLYSRLLELA